MDFTDDKDLLREKCGIVGIAAMVPVSGDIAYALRALQHRGQESAGIATVDAVDGAYKFHHHKQMGLVEQAFTPDTLRGLEGNVGIGHVRYATQGASRLENAQPILAASIRGEIAIAHNGEIVNAGMLRDELIAKGWSFLMESDSEVAVRLFANELTTSHDPVRALRRVMERIEGSYCLVLTVGDVVYAVRDPLGIKPLCFGTLPGGRGHVVASESVALDVLGATLERDVKPGEILEVTAKAVVAHAPTATPDSAHCMFEYVYFARSDSIMDGRPVYDVRYRIGQHLAKEHPAPADVVLPVPDSGRTHALGYAAASGIPFSEGLMKNRYVHRTFIMPEQADRDRGVRMKLNAVRSVVAGKRVVLVDDSIVRGTTMRRLVTMLRDAGAKEVHVRVGSPPIVAPCYLGIDMHSRKHLIASDHSNDEIRREIGADSLGYLTLDGLVDAIGHTKKDLCLGCLTGEYPVEVPGEVVRVRHQSTLQAF
ncbi:MAG: amidophosphoribosyltransferase [Thermoplasmatota archaeon]